MKTSRILACMTLAVGLGLIAHLAFRPRTGAPTPPSPPPSTPSANSSPSSRNTPTSPHSPSSNPPSRQSDRPRPLSAEEFSSLSKEIDEAVVQYDPATLPLFSRWLQSHDSRVREAAKDGLLQAGLADGAPLLRQAADQTPDPAERQELLRAAEILELPPPDPEVVRQILEKAQTDGQRLPARRLKLRDLSPPGSNPAPRVDPPPAEEAPTDHPGENPESP